MAVTVQIQLSPLAGSVSTAFAGTRMPLYSAKTTFAGTQRMASVSASAVSQRKTTATLPSSGSLIDSTRA